QYGYLPDSGGAGRFRGGLALIREYRFEEAEGTLQLRTDRRHHLPYGLQGGRDGTPSGNFLNPGTPAAQALPAKCTLTLHRGAVSGRWPAGPGGGAAPCTRGRGRGGWAVLEEKITVE